MFHSNLFHKYRIFNRHDRHVICHMKRIEEYYLHVIEHTVWNRVYIIDHVSCLTGFKKFSSLPCYFSVYYAFHLTLIFRAESSSLSHRHKIRREIASFSMYTMHLKWRNRSFIMYRWNLQYFLESCLYCFNATNISLFANNVTAYEPKYLPDKPNAYLSIRQCHPFLINRWLLQVGW